MQVRIFVEDRDEDAAVASQLDLELRDMLAAVTAGCAHPNTHLCTPQHPLTPSDILLQHTAV